MPWNLYDHQYLTQLARKPWFDYTPVVSEDRSYPGARGLVGCVAARAGDWSRRTVLVCGPPPMVDAVRHYLDEQGIEPASFHYEKFTPNAPLKATA